ncbi:MAG: hypothetical protein Q7T82_14935 [Armatimonadota bacterium]|nr:hypothetical protein [Armatimonadota bacterium]
MRRKEIVEFSYTMELVDEERAARPYLAQKIKVPIDTLILRVRFPAGENPGECLKLIYESHGATIPLLEEKAHLSIDVDEVRWDIPHPRISRYYQIRW